ncbi:MAG TPA: ATP-binding protein [Terriglobales bacterium]|nr:ATP-binding protein [Terriglobales bacterium]
MSIRSKLWLSAVVCLTSLPAVAALVMRRGFALTVLSDMSQLLLLASGLAVLLLNTQANRGRARWFWILMSAGVAFWLVYQFLWNYFEIGLRQEVPDLFISDIVLFLHLVPMIAAVALQPHRREDESVVRFGSLDFALLLIWWIFLYLFAVLPWQYASPDRIPYNRNLNALYLVEKVVLLAGLAYSWTRSSRRWRVVYGHWFGATLAYSLSSFAANWALGRQSYYTGSFYDVPLVASMAWVTVVGLIAYQKRPEQEPVASRQRIWVARLGMIAAFSLPLFAFWTLFDHTAPAPVRSFRLLLTLGTIMVMGAAVLRKQQLLDRELLSLLQASHRSFDDLKRVQAQLVQSEKLAALGELVGGAAHELNNPLTAMLGYSDLLSATPLSDSQRSMIDKISQQARRTKVLVSSLLSFARQIPGEKTLVNLSAIAQTAIKLVQPQLHTHRVELRTELAPDLPFIAGDSNQLLQVCIHILSNASQALDQVHGGIVQVSTKSEGNNVVLEFADNGPGARDPERVFDPFYTTKPVGQGTGLGLSACYGIVQEHKGKIVCRNRPQGGALFRIELPVMAADASLLSSASAKAGSQ